MEGAQQSKVFSHASAPADDFIDMATRFSGSPYKNVLAALAVGDEALLGGPGGRLVLPQDASRVVFLTGGVGITPVRSFLRDALATGRDFDDALVLYGNRSQRCVAFLDELQAIEGHGVRVVLCYEHPDAGWQGESGFITAETVLRHIGSIGGRLFAVSGPPPMVDAMEAVLDKLAVPPEARLVESFGRRTSA